MKATGADGIAIALKIGSDIICKASVGIAPAEGSKVEGESTWSARCIREAQPISFSQSDERPGLSYSAILVPLLHAGRAIGCCAAFAQRADAFAPEHVHALVAIAASAVLSVTPEATQKPAPTIELKSEEPQRTQGMSAERLKEIEAELAAFAAFEKRRERKIIAAKWIFAVLFVLALAGSFVPDRVLSWVQPIVNGHHSTQDSAPPQRATEQRVTDHGAATSGTYAAVR